MAHRSRRAPGLAALVLVSSLGACIAPAPPPGPTPLATRPPSEEGSTRKREMQEVVFPKGVERPGPDEELKIVDAVARLWSKDLTTYSNAGHELVEAGVRAVPYLGYFGKVEKEVGPGHRVNITRIVLLPILAKVPPETLTSFLSSPYAAVRVASAMVVGEAKLEAQIPHVIALLDDEQEEVRRAAVGALRRCANRFYGYRPDDPAEKRAEGVRRWKEWSESNEAAEEE